MNTWLQNEYLRGNSCEGFQLFGGHLSHEYGQDGARFSVYAPHARRVQLIGECNGWQGYDLERGENGVWSIFVQGACHGQMYKFRLFTPQGEVYDRADPFAFYSQLRPDTASILYDLEGYPWGDGEWMRTRNKGHSRPVSIYEVHLGSWRRGEDGGFLGYSQLADQLIPYAVEMGFTHLELLPLTEHPFDGSWGYQVSGYFAATSRYGEPRELMALVDRCHQAGLGVIMDFVPAHFVQDFHALHQFDGGVLYESPQEELRYSQWGTALFDFCQPHVISFVRSALHFWLSYYHFDGIRYDAVSNLIYRHGREELGPNEPGLWFLRSTNYLLGQLHPGAMLIAEDSSSYLKVTAPVIYGGLGFDYKWNLGWMHDTLDYFSIPPQQRAGHRNRLTFSMSYFHHEVFLLPLSHDEVVHGKGTIIHRIWGSYEEKFWQLRVLYLYLFTHPGKKLCFMGNELGEFKEWDEKTQLGWNLLDYPAHRDFFQYFGRLLRLYRQLPALYRQDYHSESFAWVALERCPPTLFAYRRSDLQGQRVLVVLNLSDRRCVYPLPVDRAGSYQLLMDTRDHRERMPQRLETRLQGGQPVLPLALEGYSGWLLVEETGTAPGQA